MEQGRKNRILAKLAQMGGVPPAPTPLSSAPQLIPPPAVVSTDTTATPRAGQTSQVPYGGAAAPSQPPPLPDKRPLNTPAVQQNKY